MNDQDNPDSFKPTEIKCMFLVIDNKMYVSVQDLENAYQKIIQKNDIFIDEGRSILEKQGIDVNDDFKKGFRTALLTLSSIIHEQSANLNVDLEFRDLWTRKLN
jgi:hypothetical protein